MNLSSIEYKTYVRNSLNELQSIHDKLVDKEGAKKKDRQFINFRKKITEMMNKMNTENIEESVKQSFQQAEVTWLNELVSKFVDEALTLSETLSQKEETKTSSFRTVKKVIKLVQDGYLGSAVQEKMKDRVYSSNVASLIDDLGFPKPKNKSDDVTRDMFDFDSASEDEGCFIIDGDSDSDSESDNELATSNNEEVKNEELENSFEFLNLEVEDLPTEVKDLSEENQKFIYKKLNNITRQLDSLIKNNDVPKEVVENIINRIEVLGEHVNIKESREFCNKEIQEIKDILVVVSLDERFQLSQVNVIGKTNMMFGDWYKKSLLNSLQLIEKKLNNS